MGYGGEARASRFYPALRREMGHADDKSGIPDGLEGLDCGPKSREIFAAAIARAKTIIWNGPAGVFEFEKFAEGTKSMAAAVAVATASGAITIVGGGDTATAAKKFGVAFPIKNFSEGKSLATHGCRD